MAHLPEGTDPRTGYCSSNGIYYSLRPPVWIPPNPNLDINTFLFAPQYGDKTALIDAPTGKSLTYRELERRIHVLAAGLYKKLGVRKGDVVMLLTSNTIEFPVVFFAVASLGAVVTTVNQLNTAKEIQKQMKDSGTKFIITTPESLEKVAGVGLPIVVFGEDEVGSDATCRYSDLFRNDPEEVPRIQYHQDDTVALLYSSGTTGMSKGVVLTHRNFIAAICMFNSGHDEILLPTDKYLVVLPQFHVYGLAICTVTSLARGITVVILPQFDLVKMLSAIQTYKVTTVPLVPPIIIALTKLDIVNKFDLSSLIQLGSGAAPLGKEMMIACAKRFPNIRLKQGYALTECTAICTTTPLVGENLADHYGSCGILLPNMEAMIVDPTTNQPQPPSKQGEIWIRGPSLMKEYLNNPKATSESLDKDGWFHTGDLCLFDKDGYLYVTDRLKELIKYNAYQVAPAELEALLLSHPAILDCAVIPYPDEEGGQIPMAYIVQQPGQKLTAEEIMEWVAKQVAPYKKVRKVAFIDAIPKSAAGKILRRQLVELSTAKPKL